MTARAKLYQVALLAVDVEPTFDALDNVLAGRAALTCRIKDLALGVVTLDCQPGELLEYRPDTQ